jgi:hypothetical protein
VINVQRSTLPFSRATLDPISRYRKRVRGCRLIDVTFGRRFKNDGKSVVMGDGVGREQNERRVRAHYSSKS